MKLIIVVNKAITWLNLLGYYAVYKLCYYFTWVSLFKSTTNILHYLLKILLTISLCDYCYSYSYTYV